jgi:hypothetical protein
VKKINNVSSTLAIVFIVSAVLVIGGLTVISSPTSTTMQSASAERQGIGGGSSHTENHGPGGTSDNPGGSGFGGSISSDSPRGGGFGLGQFHCGGGGGGSDVSGTHSHTSCPPL